MKANSFFRYLDQISGWLFAALFFGAAFVFTAFRDKFEYDPDEGGNVMKALLLARGHAMYTEIWSDQPPLLTYLLAVSFRLFGFEVDVGRILVLLFSAVLLAAAFYFLKLTWGFWHALAGILIIILLPYYVILSVSVMIGLPAIAMAFVSLTTLGLWHRQRRWIWLAISAVALALSVLIKTFTVFLGPVFVVGLVLAEILQTDEQNRWGFRFKLKDRKWFVPALLWGGICVVAGGILGLLLVGPSNISQLIVTHLLAERADASASFSEAQSIYQFLTKSWAILPLTLLGIIFILRNKNWLSLYLVAWMASATLLLTFHEPVWYHHQLLVTIPAAMLAGIAAGEAVAYFARVLRERKRLNASAVLPALAAVGLVLALVFRLPQVAPNFANPAYFLSTSKHDPWWGRQLFLERMAKHAPATHWVVTDLPMYAFRVGLPVPPYLAVMSGKRLTTGELTEKEIIKIVQELKPEQVLLGRHEFPELKEILDQDYRLLHTRGRRRLYLRLDTYR